MVAQHPWSFCGADNNCNLPPERKVANGSLVIRTLNAYYNIDELMAAQRLRYKVFCEHLGWVPKNDEGVEWDRYDIYATHFVAITSHGLVGYVRVIQHSQVGFMLEKDFVETLGDVELRIKKDTSIEISRMCIDSSVVGARKIADGLYKAMYQWSKINGKRYWYIVVDKRYLKALKRQHFPFVQIGPGCYFNGSKDLSVAAVLDLNHLEEVLLEERPDFLDWLKESHLEWEDNPKFNLKID